MNTPSIALGLTSRAFVKTIGRVLRHSLLLSVGALLPVTVHGAISSAQSAVIQQSGSGTSVSATLGSPPTEGNLILLVFVSKLDSPSVTLPSGFETLAESYHASTSGNASIVAAAKVAGSSESSSFTVTVDGSSGTALLVAEYESDNGFDLDELVLNQAFNYATSSTTQNVGPLTISESADLLVAISACNNNVTAWSGSWTNSFSTVDETTGSNAALAVAERYAVAAGTYSSQTTVTTSRKENGLLLALNEVVASGPTPVISEDFSVSAANFTVADGGTWSVSGGRYVLSSPQAFSVNGLLGQISVHNTALVDDYTLSSVVRITGTSSSWNDAAVIFGYQDVDNYYYASLNESNDENTMGVFRVLDGFPTELVDISSSISSDTDYTVEVIRSGVSIEVEIDNSLVATVNDSSFIGGKVGFGSKNDGAQFDDLVVYGEENTADTTDPSVPTGLAASNITNTSVDLSWSESTDNVGVAGYKVYTDGSNPITVLENTLTINGLTSSTTYDFTVSAFDAANNESNESSELEVTTTGSLIDEDFNSASAEEDFMVIAGGDWDVTGGHYVLSNPQTFTTNGLLGQISVHNTEIIGNMYLSAVVNVTGTGSSWNDAAVVFGYQDASNYYYASINESNDSSTHGLFKVVDDTPTQIADFSYSISSDTDYTIEVDWSGSSITVDIDSTQVASTSDSTFSGGKIGFGSKNDGASFDDLYVDAEAPAGDTEAPTVPTGLSVDDETETTVDLSWSAASDNVGVTGYRIYINGGSPVTATGTSTTVANLAPSTTYTFTISAVDAAGNESAQSSGVNGTTDSGTIVNPDVVAVTSSSDDGNVAENTLDGDFGTRWSASGEGEWIAYELNGTFTVAAVSIAFYNGDQRQAYFDLEISTNGTSWTTAYSGSSSGATTGFEEFHFTPASARYIRYVGDGNSVNDWNSITEVDFVILTSVDTTAPSAPSSLTATAVSQSRIDLSWTASTDNVFVAGYDIYRDSTYIVSTPQTSYQDTELEPDTNYEYYVNAYDSSNNVSSASNTDDATTLEEDNSAPSTPSGLSSSNITATTVNLSWSASSDNVAVTGYKVYTDGSNPTTVSGTSTTVIGLAPSTDYTFTVSAVDAAGNESAQSSGEDVTTSTPSANDWAPDPYVYEDLPPPGPARSGRYPARCPNINQGSALQYFQMAGEGANTWTNLGRTVYLPAGYYDANITLTNINRSGWLNLVAADGEGSVEFRGRVNLDGGRVGIRFIGIDMVGQWWFKDASDICMWGGIHQNPFGVYSPSPHCIGLHGSTSRVTLAGTIARRTQQDLYKINGAKDLLMQGVLAHETYWGSTYEDFHSDGIQTTAAAEFKLLDSYFTEGSRGQFGQEFSYPIRTYWARVVWQGTPNYNMMWDPKDKPSGPLRSFGSGVILAPRPSGTGWNDWNNDWNGWRWASRGEYGSKGGSQTGTYSTAKPAWFDEDSNTRANTQPGSPDKVWRSNNAYSSWTTYFTSSASSMAGAEGTLP